ncbi:MAG: PDDEXK nuclease domain-containing protein [Kiritimatiellaeota bacterium]|nr:PDDEXK nuclease domain-containing protein [Kiritimatiellota bacterium]
MQGITKRDKRFFNEIAALLTTARSSTYRVVNAIMVETYWNVGRRIVEQEQNGNVRADYGDYLISGLSRHLTDIFGKGFSEANLKNMRQFYATFPHLKQFASQWLANLSWTNICIIMRLNKKDERDYYLREAATENWSKRILERHIRTGAYRRLLSSQKRGKSGVAVIKAVPAKTANLNPLDFIKDPYVLEFLDIPEDLTGKETLLENALISDLQKFLLELGKGFSFIARQQRISTETDHFYVDLVFYNYLLKCFVIFDLKTKPLSPSDVGQMDMYVRMFDGLKRGADDNPTLGIIMCSDKSETVVKFSMLKESKRIFASKYETILPTEQELADWFARKRRLLGKPAKSNTPRRALRG